jgi:hypothetical protein
VPATTPSVQGDVQRQGRAVARTNDAAMAKKGQRKRAWVGDAEIGERVARSMSEGSKRVEREPWAGVVLFQVAVEVAVAAVVHWLAERQEPAMRAWIEQVRLDTFNAPRGARPA